MIPDVLTLQQLAAYLQLPKNQVQRQVANGEIPAARIGRTWRVRKSLIDQWLDKQSSFTPQTFDRMVVEVRQGMRRAGIRTQSDADRLLAKIRTARVSRRVSNDKTELRVAG
ncbi:MAG: helix-turn-helix domain-containing protein [Chloroflexi bacterium]|nr:helix-turn-helix domain-containing protein [Chloroflexota bacterium]